MGIVLRELPDARQAREHARRFVSVERGLLVESQRQIPVAAHLAAEDEHVARTVHGLHAHLLPLGLDEEHVLAIVLPVPRRFPQRLVEDERCLHLDVAGREEHSRM